MKIIYTKIFDFLEIGDNFRTVIMGFINLSPESFYKDTFYEEPKRINEAALDYDKKWSLNSSGRLREIIMKIGSFSKAPQST